MLLLTLWRCATTGWVCDSKKGGEEITFQIPLETHKEGYDVRIGFLRSYAGMGKFEVIGDDNAISADKKGAPKAAIVDGLWSKKISIYQEESVFKTTGNCTLTVRTRDQMEGATGNKVKLIAVVVYREHL